MIMKAKQLIYRILRKSEHIFQTDMVYLTKGGFWLAIGKFFVTTTSIAVAVAFANLLPQNAYGTYQFVLSLTGIIYIFTLTGLPKAVTRAVAQGFDGALIAGKKMYFKWSVLGVFVALGGAAYYFYNENLTLSLSLLIVGTLLPLQQAFGLHGPYLKGKKDFKNLTINNLFESIIPALILIGTLFATDDPFYLIVAYFAGNTFVTLILYARVTHIYQPQEESVPELSSFSKHLSLMNMIGKFANRIDRILLFHFLGAAPLAVYSFAQAPVTKINDLNSITETLVFPKLSQRDIPTLQKTLPRKLILFFFILLLITLLYVFAAQLIYEFLFPQYLESVIYSQVFAFSILLFPSNTIGQVFVAHRKQRELYIMRTLGPIFKIILFVICIPMFGIWGAIGSLLASKTFGALMSLFFFYRLK